MSDFDFDYFIDDIEDIEKQHKWEKEEKELEKRKKNTVQQKIEKDDDDNDNNNDKEHNMEIVDKGNTKGKGRSKSDKWQLMPNKMMIKIAKMRRVKHYNGNFYIYEDGRYNSRYKNEPVETLIGMDTQQIFYDIKNKDNNLANDVTINYVKEVNAHFLRQFHVFDADINKNLIGVKNGILDISTYPYKIRKNNPELFTAINIPVTYDPSVFPTEFRNFEQRLISKKYIDPDGMFYREEDMEIANNEIATFEEMYGYAFVYGVPIKKAILLLGPTHSGKSTFYNVMDEFFGVDNMSCVSLYDLADRNRPAEMVGKLINNVPDIGYNALEKRTIESFMNYTGGDGKITVEKKYRDPFDYHPSIKMYYGANFTPYVNINNSAFLQRWLIIRFPDNRFPYDGSVVSKLTTEKEKSGILNLALDGLQRLRKNKNFSLRQGESEIGRIFKENRQKAEKEDEDDDYEIPRVRSGRSDAGIKKGPNYNKRFGDDNILNLRR